jgi:hypothetical protein
MNALEDRVRRGLRTGPVEADADALLREVHRGVRRRRTNSFVAAAAAGVLAVTGVAVAVGVGTRSDRSPDRPPATHSPTPKPLPEGAATGVIDIQALSADLVFRLTTNVGCISCSTLWRLEGDGTRTPLHDFEGYNAYGGKIDPNFGPVSNFVMAADGLQGWAWGARLFSTRDGGSTWSQIAYGPGGLSEYGHEIQVGSEYAWSLHRSDDFGTELFRTPYGEEDWATVDAPDLDGTTGMFTVGNSVVLETEDEGLSAPRLQISTDGTTWSRLDMPCPGEIRARPAVSEVFVLCMDLDDPRDITVYRTRDLSRWERFGSWKGVVDTFIPLTDDRLLLVDADRTARLLTTTGTQAIDLGDARETNIYESSTTGDLVFMVAYDGNALGRLLRSSDGGRTWTLLD